MINAISIEGFKSFADVRSLELPRLAVLFGPNTAGKSNFLDAVQALSRIGTSRTLADALQDPIRGYPIETFAFPSGGLPELLSMESAEFKLGASLTVGKDRYQYSVSVGIVPSTGAVHVRDEYLGVLTSKGSVKGSPLIEKVDSELRIRRKSKPAHPRTEPIELNHSLLSDLRLSGPEYRGIEKCRNELLGWRMYYLDPRVAMRRAAPPSEVYDIGLLGENIAPYLYRVQKEDRKHFDAVGRLLRTLIPSVEQLDVDLDKRRGTLDITIRQNGIAYSSRIISEGTLRILALCAIAVNPRPAPVMAFEEPENGVQPRRLELIAELLTSLALERDCQLIVTTHSPLFCATMIKKAKSNPDSIGLFQIRRRDAGTEVRPFAVTGPLFEDTEIANALADRGEEGVFEGLVLRGMLDE
ncbi:MAG: ATP-binding protein [Thermodesulfobacteriota bacterium]